LGDARIFYEAVAGDGVVTGEFIADYDFIQRWGLVDLIRPVSRQSPEESGSCVRADSAIANDLRRHEANLRVSEVDEYICIGRGVFLDDISRHSNQSLKADGPGGPQP
jgi:hypothetical protein